MHKKLLQTKEIHYYTHSQELVIVEGVKTFDNSWISVIACDFEIVGLPNFLFKYSQSNISYRETISYYNPRPYPNGVKPHVPVSITL